MIRYRPCCVLAVFFYALAAVYAYPADQCSDILQNGIFNTMTINQSVSVKNDYEAWLCTSEFRTHQEAHDAGISIGFPVYGVPISLGGTFDSQTRDSWKRTHCSSSSDKSQYSALYQKLVSEVSDVVVNAWRDCMIALYQNRIGLTSVALAHGRTQVQMKIRWTPYDSFDKKLPKVTGFSMIGATLQTVGATLFKKGVKVPATETTVDFRRSSASDAVTLTLNTDRGSVTSYVPPETMSIRVQATITPTIEQRRVAARDYGFYQADPDDDCVKDLNFDENYFPPDGYSFASYSYEETTKNGDRTSYSSNLISNGVHFHMHVQGDDGFAGFCKRHGWLGLNIHVRGERWEPTQMTAFDTEVSGKPLQESVLIHYPYLQPSVDVRNFRMQFSATVQKLVGDEVSTVQLTDGAPTAGGVTATADAAGNLVINATTAFAEWRKSLGPDVHLASTPGAAGGNIDAEARALCAQHGALKVYEITGGPERGDENLGVVCGVDSKRVHEGVPPSTRRQKLHERK